MAAEIMPSGTFRLKGVELLRTFGPPIGVMNMHQLALRGQIGYATMHNLMTKSDEMQKVNLRHLYGILVDGLGLTPDEASELRLGDVFEVKPDTAPSNGTK